MSEIYNPNPVIFKASKHARNHINSIWLDDDEDNSDGGMDDIVEPIDQDEIYGALYRFLMDEGSFPPELIRTIYDPEHPNTLEELNVVSAQQITIAGNRLHVEFTPTVPHCGMSTLIGV